MVKLYNFNSRRTVELKEWKVSQSYIEITPLNLDNNTYAEINTKYSEILTAAINQIDWSNSKDLELCVHLDTSINSKDAKIHFDYICSIVCKLLLRTGYKHKEWRLSADNTGMNISKVDLIYLINYNTACDCFNLVLDYVEEEAKEPRIISIV